MKTLIGNRFYSQRAHIAAIVALTLGLAGCATTRVEMPAFSSGAQSNLSRKNFRLVRTNATGVSYGFALLGLIPIVSPTMSSAMHDLHKQIDGEGKAVALVNVAQDRSTTYLILFSVPSLTVSADAIEFLDEAPPVEKAQEPQAAPASVTTVNVHVGRQAQPPVSVGTVPVPERSDDSRLEMVDVRDVPTSAQAALPRAHPAPAVLPAAPPDSVPTQNGPTNGKPALEIVDLRELPSTDKNRVALSGTIINRGTKATSQLSVKVNALDEAGNVVMSVYAAPSSNVVPAQGGSTTFTATVDDRPAITKYHVEAIGI